MIGNRTLSANTILSSAYFTSPTAIGPTLSARTAEGTNTPTLIAIPSPVKPDPLYRNVTPRWINSPDRVPPSVMRVVLQLHE